MTAGETMEYNPKLVPLAREMRRNMTKEERKLWYEYLRTYPIRFRRQVPLERFILDFYCDPAKLAVELDGSQHFDDAGLARDAERTAFLEANGIMVLRFSNADVQKNLRGVCERIDQTVQKRV